MIYDRIENLSKYAKLNDGFKVVSDYLKTADLTKLSVGKVSINEEIYFAVHEYMGKEELDNEYESHEQYIDVQYVYEGEEKCNISFDKAIVNEINEKDFYVTKANLKDVLVLNPEVFVIFLPGELHKPALKLNENKVKKLVFKVPAK